MLFRLSRPLDGVQIMRNAAVALVAQETGIQVVTGTGDGFGRRIQSFGLGVLTLRVLVSVQVLHALGIRCVS